MGCKGPATSQNCPVVKWNEGANWPIGCPCIGCAEPNFWDAMTPFYQRLPPTPSSDGTSGGREGRHLRRDSWCGPSTTRSVYEFRRTLSTADHLANINILHSQQVMSAAETCPLWRRSLFVASA